MAIGTHINRFVWRIRAAVYFKWLARCILCAAFAVSLLIVADKIFFLGDGLIPSLIIIAVCFPLAGILAAALDPVTIFRTAKVIDKAAGLDDRVLSAATIPEDSSWRAAVEADAINKLKEIHASTLIPFRATLAARLIVPAAIVMALAMVVPQMDVLGRRNKRVLDEGRNAAMAQHAIASAAGASEGTEDEPPQTLGALRVSLVKIEQDISNNKMESARLAEVSEKLKKLSSALLKSQSGNAAGESIKRAAEALARGDADAAGALQAAQAELEKLERALEKALAQEQDLLINAERTAAEINGGPKAQSQPAGEDLIELPSSARNRAEPPGVIYPARTGSPPEQAKNTYQKAIHDLNVKAESGQIPLKHLPLVKSYFDSIKPADEK